MVARALLRAASPLSRKPSRRSHQRARFSRGSVGECPNEFTRKQWRKPATLALGGRGQAWRLTLLPPAALPIYLGAGSGAFWPSRPAQQRWLFVGTPGQVSARVPTVPPSADESGYARTAITGGVP